MLYHSGIIGRYTCVSHFTTTVAEHNPCLVIDYSRMISHNLQIAISGNNCVFIHYYTCIYAVDIMVGIIQDKSAGVIWNVSRILQHALCAETFQIFPRFLKMQIGAIHGRFCQNVSSLLQTALAPNAPGGAYAVDPTRVAARTHWQSECCILSFAYREIELARGRRSRHSIVN